jgi:hypothetical protein
MSTIYNNADFIESVIKYMVRDGKVLTLAKNLKMRPDDVGGVDIYKSFVKIAMDIGVAPIDSKIFLMHIKDAMTTGELSKGQEEQITEFFTWVYNDELGNSEYILEHLPKMLKNRRFGTLLRQEDKDPDKLAASLNALAFEFKESIEEEKESTDSPFDAPVFKNRGMVFATGFPAIDELVGGIGLQEYGMILGYSGAGKTAVACHSALQNVVTLGRKVLYLSLEEPRSDVSNRFYANYFSISYTNLHRGLPIAQAELKSLIDSMTPEDKKILSNLRVQSLNNLRTADGGITVQVLKQYLEQLAKDTGFIPELIYIDQLDYMRTEEETEAAWENYSKRSFDVDEFSSYEIQGKHKFSVWLLHQAAGKMKRNFTNADVSGFKGVIKPCDLVIGVGKDTQFDTDVSIFSLKSRHTKNFSVDHKADLEFMRFDTLDKGGIARIENEKTVIADSNNKKKARGFKNVPQQPELLPSAGGKFK